MTDWQFYKKDGVTPICSIPDVCEVIRSGKYAKTLRFMLTDEADYDALMAMCANVDPARARRTALRDAVIFSDTSLGQLNTIKVVDPHGEETGYGIIESFTPGQADGTKYHAFTFEFTLLWIGSTLGEEINTGVYKVALT